MSNKILLATGEPIVQYSGIPNGYADIALHLGYQPEHIVFIHSLVSNPYNHHDIQFCATDDLDIRANQYPVSLMGKKSNSFQLPLDPYHTDYLNSYIIQGNMTYVPPAAENRLHPGGSIPAALIKLIEQATPLSQDLLSGLSGKILMNSFVTKEIEDLADMTGMKTVMSAEAYAPFVSKAYVHKVAEEAGISIAPGIVFEQPDSIQSYKEQIQKLNLASGAKNETTWIKAVALSGGQGISKISDSSEDSVRTALTSIAAGYAGAGFFHNKATNPDKPFDGISYFMPIVAETDIGALPGVKDIVLNSCVQAVVGNHAITMTGTTLQHTVNGEYVGGITPLPEQQPMVFAAEQEAVKFLKKTHTDGYRGYGGVDVIVARMDDNGLKAFVLEFNPRLNASTPLLSRVQHTAQEIGSAHGHICAFSLPRKNGSVKDIYEKAIDGDLYLGRESDFTGIFPSMIDLDQGDPDRDTVFRLITVGRDAKHSTAMLENVQKRINSLKI
jgi:hypothetical protein